MAAGSFLFRQHLSADLIIAGLQLLRLRSLLPYLYKAQSLEVGTARLKAWTTPLPPKLNMQAGQHHSQMQAPRALQQQVRCARPFRSARRNANKAARLTCKDRSQKQSSPAASSVLSIFCPLLKRVSGA